MAKICGECEKKTPIANIRGSCMAKVSTDCKSWTESFSFTLCDDCAEQLGLCAWCWGPLSGSLGAVAVPTTKRFCRQFDNDNGNHVLGMYVGEQILVQMQVDFYSGMVWQPKDYDREISYYGHEIKRSPHNQRMGWIELYFDLDEVASKASIELEQVSNWGSRASSSTWAITVEIKR